jgi:hypothetical protein
MKLKKKMSKEAHSSAPASAIYGLGFIGAAIYFIAHASGFWMGVSRISKSHSLAGFHGI